MKKKGKGEERRRPGATSAIALAPDLAFEFTDIKLHFSYPWSQRFSNPRPAKIEPRSGEKGTTKENFFRSLLGASRLVIRKPLVPGGYISALELFVRQSCKCEVIIMQMHTTLVPHPSGIAGSLAQSRLKLRSSEVSFSRRTFLL